MKRYEVVFEEAGKEMVEEVFAESRSGARNRVKADHPRAIRVRIVG